MRRGSDHPLRPNLGRQCAEQRVRDVRVIFSGSCLFTCHSLPGLIDAPGKNVTGPAICYSPAFRRISLKSLRTRSRSRCVLSSLRTEAKSGGVAPVWWTVHSSDLKGGHQAEFR